MTSYPGNPILIVDDDAEWIDNLAFSLEIKCGIDNTISCSDSRQVLEILEKRPISLILLDLTMPHLTGEALLPLVIEKHPEIPVFILTSLNEIDTAVRCIKNGADNFFLKTGEIEHLGAAIRKTLSYRDVLDENRRLRETLLERELARPEVFSEINTKNGRMFDLFRYAEVISGSREPVLITGESGSGKELFARAVHRLSRPDGPFVAINVAGLDEAVFSDTLFGHVRGAFSGADRYREGMVEQARKGTLFLDEIGDLNPASQVKLLRFIQDGEYFPLGSDTPKRSDVRIVVATHQDIEREGTFRRDLYYRLAAHKITIPPLRERKEDIPLLVDHFIKEADPVRHEVPPPLRGELLSLFESYSFPGNVRELRALVHDALRRPVKGEMLVKEIRDSLFGQADSPSQSLSKEGPALNPFDRMDLLPSLAEAGDLLIDAAMRRVGGSQSAASKILGISQQAVSKRLAKLRSDT